MKNSLAKKVLIIIASVAVIALAAFFIVKATKKHDAPAGVSSTQTEAASEPVSSEEPTSESEAASEPAVPPEPQRVYGDFWKEKSLFGEPWVNSNVSGNLPDDRPSEKDDFYLNCNYDYIREHQDENSSVMLSGSEELMELVEKVLAENSADDPEIAQLRIFYDQAHDLKALKKAGISGLRPYIDSIMDAGSIAELNEVLTADDFPFDPFLLTIVSPHDMSGVNEVMIIPRLLFADSLSGVEYYHDSDDPEITWARQMVLLNKGSELIIDIGRISEYAPRAQEILMEILDLEKSYVKDCDYSNLYMTMNYGAMTESNESYDIDTLQSICPSFPIKQILIRSGRDASPRFHVSHSQWLKSLNDIWTDDNLETIKELAIAKILDECSPYLDPSPKDAYREMIGDTDYDAADNAYGACEEVETFGHLVGRLYVEKGLGPDAAERIEKLSRDLIGTYKTLIAETEWISSGVKLQIAEKLDKMRLCILSPEGGYADYTGLKLVPSDRGGTLLGNYLTLKAWHNDRVNALIGQKAKAMAVWNVYSPTVQNAFYDQESNSINVYPGIVTSNMYTSDMTDEELMGTLGYVIGHEISHGFDYLGSQYDAYGRGRLLFLDSDAEAFLARRDALVDYYNGISIFDGKSADGVKLSGEAASDLCSIQVLLRHAREIPGFDYKLFFEKLARVYGEVRDATTQQVLSLVDEHPMDYLRVNVNVQMYDEFYDTYGVSEGDGMYLAPECRVRIWGADSDVPAKRASDPGAGSEVILSHGTAENGVYTNDSLDISFTLPEGWELMSDTYLCNQNGIKTTVIDDEVLQSCLESNGFFMEMMAGPKDLTKCNVNIILQATPVNDAYQFLAASLSSNGSGTCANRSEGYQDRGRFAYFWRRHAVLPGGRRQFGRGCDPRVDLCVNQQRTRVYRQYFRHR